MKATGKKIDLGGKKKKSRSGFFSVFLFVVVAGGLAYYFRDQPLALGFADAIDRLISPIRNLIDAMLRTG
jgi:hypothetical protein